MTKDEIIMELMELLKLNGREKQAGSVFEMTAYVDMLGNKLEQMTNELVKMREELQSVRQQQMSKTLKQNLTDMYEKAQARCENMKQTLIEVKENMKSKALEIVSEVRQKGKEALSKVSEFFGVKERLNSIRENLRQGIIETDRTLARIDGFSDGVKTANEYLANSFRELAGKEKVDYSKREYVPDISILRKPWVWQKKVYQNMQKYLDTAIEKVENLSAEVQLHEMEQKWETIYEQTHGGAAEELRQDSNNISMVSEPQYQYGAEMFEDYMKQNEMTVQKTDKNIMKDIDVKMEMSKR